MFRLFLKYLWFRFSEFWNGSTASVQETQQLSSITGLILKAANPTARFYPSTLVPDRSMWGLNRHLAQYNSPRTYFEHGIYFGDYIAPQQRLPFVDRIVTQSQWRADLLEDKLDKSVVVVDNYMYWVNLDERALPIHSEFYLYFPAHSTRSLKTSFSVDEAVQNIRGYVGDAKILISLFHLDFSSALVSEVLASGAEPICFGHRYSPYFLENFKLVATRSSGIFTSDIGSHVGYALAIGKVPKLIEAREIEHIQNKPRWNKEVASYNDIDSADAQKEHVADALRSHLEEGKFSPQQSLFLSNIFGLR